MMKIGNSLLLHQPRPSSRRAVRLPSLFGESTAAGPGRSVALSPAESCRSDVVARRLRFGYALRSLVLDYARSLLRPLRGRCALRADRRYAFILAGFPPLPNAGKSRLFFRFSARPLSCLTALNKFLLPWELYLPLTFKISFIENFLLILETRTFSFWSKPGSFFFPLIMILKLPPVDIKTPFFITEEITHILWWSSVIFHPTTNPFGLWLYAYEPHILISHSH